MPSTSFEYQPMSTTGGRIVAGEPIPRTGPSSPPRSPPSSPPGAASSADYYRSLSPSASSPLPTPPVNPQDNIALSSIHSPAPFLGHRNSDMSDSEFTRTGADSPWIKDEGFRDSRAGSTALLNQYEDEGEGHTYPAGTREKSAAPASASALGAKRQKNRRWLLLGLLALVALIAVGVGVGVTQAKKGGSKASENTGSTGSSNGNGDGTATAGGTKAVMWGTGNSAITANNGTQFFYNNTLGGTWVSIPFNDTARPAADQPALNEKWNYGQDRIFGVNIGGWLVLEPFIAPSLFQPYANAANPAIDEWTLCENLGSNMATVIENHYNTFITEEDFANIAAAGLNWIRLPVAWWMIEVWDGEPFLEGVSFKYFLKALEWARKYGLRVNLDLHAVPGSQNGYNHSGKFGTINFLNGIMGIANAQRTLNYIRTLTEFISQPQYSNVVPMFSVLNEAIMQQIGATALKEYYYEVYQMVRGITGVGEGKGPFMVLHDGFGGPGGGHLAWAGYLQGADRLGLDTHPYFAFSTQSDDSITFDATKPCTFWATSYNTTMTNFGFNMAGEYSLAINDCGLYLNNVNWGTRYDGTYPNTTSPDTTNYPRIGSCDAWNDYTTWSPALKTGFADMMWASQDSFQNSFFWTWRIGAQLNSALTPNPMWSYELGLREGWIRPDARRSNGGCAIACAKQGIRAPTQAWAGTLSAWQTGGAGAGTIAPAQASSWGTWPPASISGNAGAVYSSANLPQYTPTGTIKTLSPTQPVASLFPSGDTNTAAGNGWFASADTTGYWTSAAGCSYANPWSGVNQPYPTAACGGGGAREKRAPLPVPTAPPAMIR